MRRETIVIGIAGGTGSGKTSLAGAIVRALGARQVLVLDQDSYYCDLSVHGGRPVEQIDFDHPASVDLDLLAEHVGELKAGRSIAKPTYHFPTHTRRPGMVVEDARPVVVVEGILVLWHPALRDHMTLKVYVEADDDVRLIRRLRRDVAERGRSLESVLAQYESTVRRGHLNFVEPSKRWADLIVRGDGDKPGTGFEKVAQEVARLFTVATPPPIPFRGPER